MTTRKRIRTKQPNVTGGGGSTPTVGNLEWGPDFGSDSGSDGVTFTDVSTVDLFSLAERAIQPVTDTVDLASFTHQNTKTIVDTIQPALSIANTSSTVDSVDLDRISVAGLNTVVDTVDLFAISDTNTAQVVDTLSGSVLGAPFFDTRSFSSNDDPLGVTSLLVFYPVTVNAGDLLLLFVGTNGTVDPATPSGYSVVIGTAASNNRIICYSRIADGTEDSGSFTLTWSATATNPIASLHLVRGVNQTTPINVSDSGAASVTDPVLPSVTTTVPNCLVYGAVYHDHVALAQTHTPPSGHTERDDIDVGSPTHRSLWTGTRAFASSGATGTATVDCTELVASQASYLRIAVAPGSLVIA